MRRLSLLILLLILAACSGGESDRTLSTCTTRTRVESFSLCIPDGWILATSNFGNESSSVLTFHREGTDEPPLYVHVKHEALQDKTLSPLLFAKRGREIASQQAPEYLLISIEDIQVNSARTLLHVFLATPDEGRDPIAYYQLILPVDGRGYGFSATLQREMREEDEALVRSIYESITFDPNDPASST